MRLFDPDPSLRWLFCMTHPDDEISICAWIRRLTMAGAHVSVCWTHSTPLRENEARAVSRRLGVEDARLTFLNAPDGDTCDHMGSLVPLMREVIEKANPDRIACGAFEQGHLDHDATNWIVNSAWHGPVLEIPFYHAYHTRLQNLNQFSHREDGEGLILTEAEERLKREIAKQFPSQNIWSVLLWHEVWKAVRLRPAQLASREWMRLQTHTDFRTPNLPPRLAGKVLKTRHWRRWLLALQNAECVSEPTKSAISAGA